MILITKKSILDNLCERYKMMYPNNIEFVNGDTSDGIFKKLTLETNLTEDKVNEIMGNKSWTRNVCDECKQDSYAIVIIGEQVDYESSTAQICIDCLKKAIELTTA